MTAANDPGMGLPGQVEVIGIATLAAHEVIILLAEYGLPDCMFLQCDGIVEGEVGGVPGRFGIHKACDSWRFGAVSAIVWSGDNARMV
jgi:hypothetical protein